MPHRGTSNEYHNICFCWEIRKISAFFGWKKCLICCYGNSFWNWTWALGLSQMLMEGQMKNWTPIPSKQFNIQINIFSYFSINTYFMGIIKALAKPLLMSTHNICFCGETRQISIFFGWKLCLNWSYDKLISSYLAVGRSHLIMLMDKPWFKGTVEYRGGCST